MIIDKGKCSGCGKCVAECPKAAIRKNGGGGYIISAESCNDCRDYIDIECARICPDGAVTRNDGSQIPIDRTRRFRSEHIVWLMAVLGSRDGETFPPGTHEWDMFRELICELYKNPDMKVRLTKYFDDNCVGCPKKQMPGHPEVCGSVDEASFKKLGLEPGAVMRLWDAVQLAEDKLSIPFIQSLGTMPYDAIYSLLRFVSPSAKLLNNH